MLDVGSAYCCDMASDGFRFDVHQLSVARSETGRGTIHSGFQVMALPRPGPSERSLPFNREHLTPGRAGAPWEIVERNSGLLEQLPETQPSPGRGVLRRRPAISRCRCHVDASDKSAHGPNNSLPDGEEPLESRPAHGHHRAVQAQFKGESFAWNREPTTFPSSPSQLHGP